MFLFVSMVGWLTIKGNLPNCMAWFDPVNQDGISASLYNLTMPANTSLVNLSTLMNLALSILGGSSPQSAWSGGLSWLWISLFGSNVIMVFD